MCIHTCRVCDYAYTPLRGTLVDTLGGETPEPREGQGMKKNIPPSILIRLAITRGRQKAWREKPERMEQIRQRATAKAAAQRHANHADLVARLADLPAAMTTDQVLAYIDGRYRGKPGSFFNRLRRHGLMTWDYHADVWVNHCYVFPVA